MAPNLIDANVFLLLFFYVKYCGRNGGPF